MTPKEMTPEDIRKKIKEAKEMLTYFDKHGASSYRHGKSTAHSAYLLLEGVRLGMLYAEHIARDGEETCDAWCAGAIRSEAEKLLRGNT